MHPASTLLFLIGYGLAIPTGSRLLAIVARQHRLAFMGHQIGVIVAALGWALRGKTILFVIHLVWLVAARVWFGLAGRPSAE